MALLDKLKIGGTVYDAWATKDQVGSANDASSATTVFGKIRAVIDYLVGIVTTNPYAKEATTAKEEHLNWLNQHFGIEGAYEAEAKGGERTNNTVIDECKARFQDAFNGLLPTGFTMPNSVTVDNLTYTGTTNS